MNKFKLLESLDSGSNYNFGEKMNQPKNPKSLFDLSHLVTLTIPNAGMVIPITQFECLPGDDHDIDVDCLLRVLPQTVPLYSRQRLYVYAFYNRYADLWNNWQVFMDKGYTGTVQKFIPHLQNGVNEQHFVGERPGSSDKVTCDTLYDFMGLPIGSECDALFGTSASDSNVAYISALPFMALLRIYRDYFMNKNEFINDRVMLPDDDSRFRLDDDGKLLSAKDQNKNFYFKSDDYYDLMIGEDTYTFSGFYHEYPDDYFISALPFTQRGTAPNLNYEVDLSQIGLDFSQAVRNPVGTVLGSDSVLLAKGSTSGSGLLVSAESQLSNDDLTNALNRAKLLGSNIGLAITVEDIRELCIAQTEMEILARSDGSYAQFGLSFFGERSKASHDYRPTYIGGTYKNIAFTEVLQTSASSGGNPLGNYAGHGITGITKGRIGHIHCDDYGIITVLACIMPDIYYHQGLDRLYTDRIQDEKYLPLRSKLGLQPIYNKELFYNGDNGNEQGQDNYLWAYQNPYDYLRYIPSKIKGKIADFSQNSFFPYTQARHFTQLPNWGRDFSEAKDVRKDYLAGGILEDAYTAQFKINIRSVREMPYKSVPASIIS